MAKKKCFPYALSSKPERCKNVQEAKKKGANNTQGQTWIAFTYHSALIRKVTNIHKHTNWRTAYRANNTLFSKLQIIKEPQDILRTLGVYKLTSGTCSRSDGKTTQNQICRAPKIH